MTPEPLTLDAIDDQEAVFAAAFAAADIGRAGHLYHRDVVYLSPTTRLFGWPRRIVGRRQTLEFIDRTISGLTDIGYVLDERAVIPGGGAYTRIFFDFGAGDRRLRSVYVVVYRYRDGLIAQQELYYDPNDRLDDAPVAGTDASGPPDR
jgi:ketosteroid isomerase-like protein